MTTPAPGSPCVICLEPDVQVRGRLSTCKHIFCFFCISQWALASNTCPLCKSKFRCISELVVSTGIVLSKKRVGEKSQEIESEFDELDLSIDDVSELRNSIRSKYMREINSIVYQSDSSDEDFSEFIVPDHFDSDSENFTPQLDSNILDEIEVISDSFDMQDSSIPQVLTSVQLEDNRIVSEYFLPNSRNVNSKAAKDQPRNHLKIGKKAKCHKMEEEILENIRKFGNTGWISK
ncbi:hypothetical protein LOD99_8247 [Oopsacas minuta]|uniref:RING-type domain-containing protein n=1 Tax=Oopsacas minuta TaxID=111878 RepID=A0AAV7JGM5_9METZ|nr:hypothetical protein LOD99_8247 [Oopsacas minuta]